MDQIKDERLRALQILKGTSEGGPGGSAYKLLP